MSKLHIKKGDMVLVIAGRDNYKITGKTPHKVLKVLVDEQRAIVEGVNMVSKRTKPSAQNPTRVSIKHEGKNVIRISKKSGEVIK